jgi:hypothetical protein
MFYLLLASTSEIRVVSEIRFNNVRFHAVVDVKHMSLMKDPANLRLLASYT